MSEVGKITPVIARRIADWLGTDGIDFFTELKSEHGSVCPVLMVPLETDPSFSSRKIPHPVHLREGMQVRNFMREIPECEAWEEVDSLVLDNVWVEAVEAALEIADMPRRCFICGEVPPLYEDEYGALIHCESPECKMRKNGGPFNPSTNIHAWNYLSLTKDIVDMLDSYDKTYTEGRDIDYDEMFTSFERIVKVIKREYDKI